MKFAFHHDRYEFSTSYLLIPSLSPLRTRSYICFSPILISALTADDRETIHSATSRSYCKKSSAAIKRLRLSVSLVVSHYHIMYTEFC